jgi:hypothetical protein
MPCLIIGEAPNDKYQIPNKFQCPKFKILNRIVLVIVNWLLEFIWDLGFGIWDLIGSV